MLDERTGALRHLGVHGGRINAVGFGLHGTAYTLGDDGRVGLVNLPSGSPVGWLPANAALFSVTRKCGKHLLLTFFLNKPSHHQPSHTQSSSIPSQ